MISNDTPYTPTLKPIKQSRWNSNLYKRTFKKINYFWLRIKIKCIYDIFPTFWKMQSVGIYSVRSFIEFWHEYEAHLISFYISINIKHTLMDITSTIINTVTFSRCHAVFQLIHPIIFSYSIDTIYFIDCKSTIHRVFITLWIDNKLKE